MPDRRTVLAAAGGAAVAGAAVGGAWLATGDAEPAAAARRDDPEHRVTTARRFFELLSAKDIDTWADLWHDTGRIIIFYPADGFPNTIDGKATIVPAFRDMFTNYETFTSEITAVYPAADSDAVVVEYSNDAVLTGGTRYTNDNIAVFRFRDGLITTYHDYFDPRRFQVVVDHLS